MEYSKIVDTEKEKLRRKINEDNAEFDIIINDINITFYNSEEETIEAFFDKLHLIDPDILGGWNVGYDMKTLMNRLTFLYSKKKELKEQGIRGYDHMLSVVCDKKYMLVKDRNDKDIYLTPKAYYKQNKDKVIVDRMDEFYCLDGIITIDQMLLYANVRKATVKESYSLDSIANEELGREKLDYKGYTIKDLAWRNFEMFLEYNIKDVELLQMLETKNLDIDMLQRLSEITNTRKYKVFKKTVSIKNFVSKFAEMQGYIMNNNKNSQYGDDTAYFEEQFLNKKEVKEYDQKYLTAFSKRENYGA